MKAIVLAGGFATRLRPLTLTKPKPVLPILGKPLIRWIIEGLRGAGVSEVVVCARYMAEHVEKALEGVEGVDVKVLRERKPLGDAGPLKLVEREVGLDSTFLVVYGDVFSDVDVARLVSYHRSVGAIATLTLVEVDDPSRYGVAELEDGKIVRFVEKPRREEAPSNLANAGVYVFEPEVLKYVPSDRPSKIARDVVPRLVDEGVVYGYVHRGLWIDIGVPSDYLRANVEALKRFYPEGYVDPSASIGEDVELQHPVYIARGASISRKSVIGPHVVIGPRASIGEGTRIRNAVLFDDVQVDSYAYIDSAIVGSACVIGKWCRIERGCVLGDEVVLADGVLLARRTYVLPYKEVEASIYEENKVIL
ncbi:MAG: NDP-sugar synthase [Crenarchaeota archaeon]|nr:NDP-sugar synthase [Thermoproteota archaeon]